MKNEPLGLYLVRLIGTVVIVILLLMLYWSNSLIEENIQSLIKGFKELKSEKEMVHILWVKVKKSKNP